MHHEAVDTASRLGWGSSSFSSVKLDQSTDETFAIAIRERTLIGGFQNTQSQPFDGYIQFGGKDVVAIVNEILMLLQLKFS